MKSHLLYASLIAMLLVSCAAFGEILTTYDWDGNCGGNPESSSPSATAGSSNNYDYKWGDGWEYTYSTVTANCDWYYHLYSYAEGLLILYDNDYCSAVAIADTDGSCQGDSISESDYTYASIDIRDSGTGGLWVFDDDYDDNAPDGVDKNGWGLFEAYYDGVSVEHTVLAIASVPEETSCTALAHAYAYAIGGMNE
jgi:hypothetical protein